MSQLPGAVLECRLSALLEVLYPPQFTLRCAMDSCPASRAVFWIWKHHGDTVSATSSLELEAVTAAQAGWYQCLANHKLGNYSSVSYFLTVVEADTAEQEARRRSISPMRPCHPPPADITPYPAASPSQGATTETSRETKDR